MRIIRLLALITVCSVFVSLAQARVGESETELVHRYGDIRSREPARKSSQGRTYTYGEYLHFRSEDWSINALVINGRCEEVTYSKSGQWTEEQLKHILEVNGGRSQWEEQRPKNQFSPRQWKRRDKTMATFNAGVSLEIKTPLVEQTRATVEKAAKEEASKLPKF